MVSWLHVAHSSSPSAENPDAVSFFRGEAGFGLALEVFLDMAIEEECICWNSEHIG